MQKRGPVKEESRSEVIQILHEIGSGKQQCAETADWQAAFDG
jgi:hypothetical protein